MTPPACGSRVKRPPNRSTASPSDILGGRHAVTEALRAGRRRLDKLYATPARIKSGDELLRLAAHLKLPVEPVSVSHLNELAQTTQHQGWALQAGPYPCSTDLPQTWRQVQARSAAGFWLILDQIADPHNLGALLRTALCAGVDGVICPKNHSAPLSPTVSRISAGAMEHIHMVQVTNLVRSLQWLQQQGLWLTGLAREASHSLFTLDFRGPAGLLIGGEARGLRRLVRQHCDQLATIPQLTDFNSLNASAAGAIALYEVYRQRNTGC